jgi:hypothetical protein
MKLMSYVEIMHAAKSDNPVLRARGREHFLMRLDAKRQEDRLRAIERDVLCRLYGLDPVTVHSVWLRGMHGR